MAGTSKSDQNTTHSLIPELLYTSIYDYQYSTHQVCAQFLVTRFKRTWFALK